jgi:hypothetical protein
LGNVTRTIEYFAWYSSDDSRVQIEGPWCRQNTSGNFLAVSPLNWDDIIDDDDDEENWADPKAPSSGQSPPGDDNVNDASEGEDEMQGCEKWTGPGNGTYNGKETGQGKGKGNHDERGIGTLYEAASNTEVKLQREYLGPEASPMVSISSDDNTDSSESDGKNDSECDPDDHIRTDDDVDTPDNIYLNGNVDIERDGDNDEEKDEEEVDGKRQDKEEEDEKMDEYEEEDQKEDDGKVPQTIGQRGMVITLADAGDTMVGDQPIVICNLAQAMRVYTPRPQPGVPAPWPQTPDPRTRIRPPEALPISQLHHVGLVTPHKPHPAVPTLGVAEAASNTSKVDVDQQQQIQSAGGNRLPDVSPPDVSHPNVPLPQAHQDCSVDKV